MVYQLTMPWTLLGKELAILKSLEDNYKSYFEKAAIQRPYSPRHVPERALLRRYAKLFWQLDEKTREMIKEMLKGFLAVESFVDDYVYAGARHAQNKLTILENTYRWGLEERRHGQIFRYCLIDAGMMTQQEVDEFLDQCAQDMWTFERQTGMAATASNTASYTVVQERHTRHNYTKFRLFLMRLFKETGNQLLEILAKMVRYVEIDEGAHEGNFRAIGRIYQKYRPDLFIESFRIALDAYDMPKVVFPDQEKFTLALVAASVFSGKMQFARDVFRPAMKGMGFKDRKAVRTAEAGLINLPLNAVVQIQGKADWSKIEEDAEPFELTSEGLYVPVSLAA